MPDIGESVLLIIISGLITNLLCGPLGFIQMGVGAQASLITIYTVQLTNTHIRLTMLQTPIALVQVMVLCVVRNQELMATTKKVIITLIATYSYTSE